MSNENINVGGDKRVAYKTEVGEVAQEFISKENLVLDADPEFINLKPVTEDNETREEALARAYEYLQKAMKELAVLKIGDKDKGEKNKEQLN